MVSRACKDGDVVKTRGAWPSVLQTNNIHLCFIAILTCKSCFEASTPQSLRRLAHQSGLQPRFTCMDDVLGCKIYLASLKCILWNSHPLTPDHLDVGKNLRLFLGRLLIDAIAAFLNVSLILYRLIPY